MKTLFWRNVDPNTINIPLNAVGLGDAEYAAMLHSLVLPLIHQWAPQLILVSCGFDAAIGDPQGEMRVLKRYTRVFDDG